ncbi:HD domain protein [Vibrio phage 1.009.O._10N.261.51.C9]|nr:HD domain protein [Vibrio phage 1.009.O._10N.261.51.C9]
MSIIALSNGNHHDFMQPGFDLSPATIARALSHINRFTGHVGAYSVAQHSVMVARLLPEELKLSGLLHDAHESIVGDMSSPLKQLVPEFKRIEEYYLDCIDSRFNVQTRHELVREADLRMLVTEAKAFSLPLDHFPDLAPACTELKRWAPVTAAAMWVDCFHAYKGVAL